MMGSDIGESIRGFSRLYQGSAAVCWENFVLRRDSQIDVWASSPSSIVYEAYLWGRGDRLAWLTPPVWHEETGHREVTSPRWSACLSARATSWDVGHSPLESPAAAGVGRRVVEGQVLEGALGRLPGVLLWRVEDGATVPWVFGMLHHVTLFSWRWCCFSFKLLLLIHRRKSRTLT